MESSGNELTNARRHERNKYRTLYSRPTEYGSVRHGRGAQPLIQRLQPASLLDVGCGDNSFCGWSKQREIRAVGVDFAHPQADVHASAHDLPFADDAFDWLTAFDVLEHLLPEEVEEVLKEFARVARIGWVFSICYRDSITRVAGETLHPTVRSEDWWISQLERHIAVQTHEGYLWGLLRKG